MLEACKDCYTQNPNESLHHVVWGLAPKEQFPSTLENALAMNMGVALFNDGFYATMSKIFQLLNLPCSKASKEVWLNIDRDRAVSQDLKNTQKVKTRRKKLKRNKVKKKEGFRRDEKIVHYKSNHFS